MVSFIIKISINMVSRQVAGWLVYLLMNLKKKKKKLYNLKHENWTNKQKQKKSVFFFKLQSWLAFVQYHRFVQLPFQEGRVENGPPPACETWSHSDPWCDGHTLPAVTSHPDAAESNDHTGGNYISKHTLLFRLNMTYLKITYSPQDLDIMTSR